jgi:hypothetical protein
VNFQQLSMALDDRKIDPSAYSVDGRPETYVIQFRRSGWVGKPSYWVTYYSERGLETGRREFASEDEACRYFLDWVSSDPTARLE